MNQLQQTLTNLQAYIPVHVALLPIAGAVILGGFYSIVVKRSK